MDIVHHAFIGGVGRVALSSQQQELAGLGFLAGSVVPDLDVAFMAGGKRFYLKRHQGPTHSLPLAPLYAAILASILALEVGWQWAFFLGVLAGLVVHVTLDWFNTFGIQLLWPFSRRRFCLDAVFFIDSVAWTLTALYFAATTLGNVPAGPAAVVYASLFAAYCVAKRFLQRRVRRRLGADVAIPSAWNPFAFFIFARRDGVYETALYDALADRTSDVRRVPATAADIEALAQASPVYRDMRAVLRALNITEVERTPEGTRLVARDLAVRNFGGRFGRTELRFDAQGRLSHEVADI